MNVLGEKINLVSFVIVAQELEREREREGEGEKVLKANLFMQNEYIFYKWSINRFKYA